MPLSLSYPQAQSSADVCIQLDKLIVHGKPLNRIGADVEIIALLNNGAQTLISLTKATHATVMQRGIYPPFKIGGNGLELDMGNAV